MRILISEDTGRMCKEIKDLTEAEFEELRRLVEIRGSTKSTMPLGATEKPAGAFK